MPAYPFRRSFPVGPPPGWRTREHRKIIRMGRLLMPASRSSRLPGIRAASRPDRRGFQAESRLVRLTAPIPAVPGVLTAADQRQPTRATPRHRRSVIIRAARGCGVCRLHMLQAPLEIGRLDGLTEGVDELS